MIRLKDIAEKTGYSINTVSLALNRKGCVSREAREAIEACASEMGYVANFTAQKLRMGKSRVLALIADSLVSMGNPVVVNDAISYAYEKGKCIPDDVSLIGLGNISSSLAVAPFVTKVDVSDEKLSHVALDLLIEKINGGSVEKRVLPVSISEGGSVRDMHQR